MDVGFLVASLLIGFAAYRVWRIVAKDQIADFLRVWLIRREGRFWEYVNDLVGCAWCLGTWLAGAAALLVSAGWSIQEYVIVWLSASAVAGLLGEIDGRMTRESEIP